MDFKAIEKYFEQNNTTKYNDTTYNQYEVKWAFEGFDKLISKTTFQAHISLNLDFQMNFNFITEMDNEIDQMREFFKVTSQALQKYLSEVKDKDEQVVKTYIDFLNNFYKNFRDYINEGFIPWVYASVMHKEVHYKNSFYDANKFLEMMLLKFKLKMMKKMKEYIKKISSWLPEDQVFGILVKAYNDEIENQENELQLIKKEANI